MTIYSTWRGLINALASPALLMAVGGLGVATAGPTWPPLVILTIGFVLGLISLFDYPRQSHFTAQGIERICYLRRHLIPWDRVTALERSRVLPPRRRPTWLGGDPDSEPRPGTYGGLVANTGGRGRHLLVNHVESRREFDELVAALSEWSPATFVRAKPPPESAVPSDLYRRKSRSP